MSSVMSRAIKCSQSSWGNNPLLVALSHDNIDRAKNLIRVNPELSSRRISAHGYTTMHLICEVADGPTVKELIGEVQPDFLCSLRDLERGTLLHFAAEKGKEVVLRALLTRCPNSIQELNLRAETPLHVALQNGQIGCFFVLVKQLQNLHFHWMDLLNRQDYKGNTVFHIAILRKQVKVVKVLLSYKRRNGDRVVNVNSINNSGLTAKDLFCQNISDRNDRDICDMLHQARAKNGDDDEEPPSCEGQVPSDCLQSVLGRIKEKMMQENMDLMKKSLLLAVFIFLANAAHDGLLNLSNIYPLEHHVETLNIRVKDIIRSPNLLPDVFYVIVANSIAFFGSMSVILVNTCSMASKWSLCYRALPLLVAGAMLVSYGLAAKKMMPKFLIIVGPHKVPSFLVACLFDLQLFCFTVAAWLIGKQIFRLLSAT
ncbi:uncharacterized protein LOC132269831 [Cornus florida]|uniref:uncharacterized protein LOC132269831 n=1 Tax=Cornus florida TaxID=4283 RepID=UPI0028A1F2BE|nr:uncharacterized protein LOC132269831 [Cornus florida]